MSRRGPQRVRLAGHHCAHLRAQGSVGRWGARVISGPIRHLGRGAITPAATFRKRRSVLDGAPARPRFRIVEAMPNIARRNSIEARDNTRGTTGATPTPRPWATGAIAPQLCAAAACFPQCEVKCGDKVGGSNLRARRTAGGTRRCRRAPKLTGLFKKRPIARNGQETVSVEPGKSGGGGAKRIPASADFDY